MWFMCSGLLLILTVSLGSAGQVIVNRTCDSYPINDFDFDLDKVIHSNNKILVTSKNNYSSRVDGLK